MAQKTDRGVEGVPIGVLPSFQYEQNTTKLASGDRIYMFSDGLIEAFNDREEPFGLDRFRATLEGLRNVSLNASVASVIEEVQEWTQNKPFTDDVSIVGFEAP